MIHSSICETSSNDSSWTSLYVLLINIRYLPYIELGRWRFQPLSAGNSTEFSKADYSKTTQRRAMNLTSLDSLGSCEMIDVYFKPINMVET